MSTQPEVVDNLNRSHRDALEWLAANYQAPLSVATGYVNLEGLVALAQAAERREQATRLLLGATPSEGELPGSPGETARDRFRQSVDALRRERDWNAFPSDRATKLELVYDFLSSVRTEVRHYTRRFLHGKTYLLGQLDGGQPSGQGAALVTSANLTGAGLGGNAQLANLELGMAHYQPSAVTAALGWYGDLWEQAQDYKRELRELLLPPIAEYDPQTIFRRILMELFDLSELGTGAPLPKENRLADFQEDGYQRAQAILNQYHGVLYADGVGMGKTEIGLQFVRDRLGQRALIISPAQLRDDLWQQRLKTDYLPGEVVSYQELANDEQLGGNHKVLAVHKDAYRLIIVDEAHNYRNSGNTWHRAITRLMSGPRKDLVMLTATPVNNTLWDLYNLFMLFAQYDSAFAAQLGIANLRQYFKDAGKGLGNSETEGGMFRLLNAVTVRRNRSFVMRNYPNAKFADGSPVRFPTPQLQETRYDLDGAGDAYDGVADHVTEVIESLKMARYRPEGYLLENPSESKEEALAGLIQSQLLKRFESSWYSALKTTDRMISDIDALLSTIEIKGIVPPGDELRELAEEMTEEGELPPATLDNALDQWGEDAIPIGRFNGEFIPDLERDRQLLEGMSQRLKALESLPDPKLQSLREVMTGTTARKVAVFTAYTDTAEYLQRHINGDPSLVGGRPFTAVLGNRTDPQERARQVERFCPKSESEDSPGSVPTTRRKDEVDVLLSTDVMSEGQNLQQAQAVVSFDMPWNPQRVVQRNGRVIRLKSPHDEVFLYTLLPKLGTLEKLLKLESKLQQKILAANKSIGMESQVLESIEAELRDYADRLSQGDATLLEEGDTQSGFTGERYRADLAKYIREEGANKLERLPWGIGSAFVSDNPRVTEPLVYFACRTKEGQRYQRMVSGSGALLDFHEERMLLLADPKGLQATDIPEELDLQQLFFTAADDLVASHNEKAAVPPGDRLPPAQRWAVQILTRSPDFPERLQAIKALQTARPNTFVKELRNLRRERDEDQESANETYARRIAGLVTQYGLDPGANPTQIKAITRNDIGVVCYQVVLPAEAETGRRRA